MQRGDLAEPLRSPAISSPAEPIAWRAKPPEPDEVAPSLVPRFPLAIVMADQRGVD